MDDRDYMRLALGLAEKGCGWTSPNPLVGAVIVKNNRVIGQGYHKRYGDWHAERNALKDCQEATTDATMYVTLEPCCHQGKQPPCTDAILAAGIRRVVVGSTDPNPLVAGKGLDLLRAHGVLVETGLLKEECDRLNEVFFHFIQHQRPYVVMKYAMTLDGKIATYTGASQWITGEIARQHVQKDRHRYSAIMVGIGTVLADDPLLTCRLPGGKNPLRIICDSQLRTPLTSKIVQTARDVPTILATLCDKAECKAPYEAAGCQVWPIAAKNGRINLAALMDRLGAVSIDSVLLEGGATLNWSALAEGLVQKVQIYLAPKLFGGSNAPSPIGGQGVRLPQQGIVLKNTTLVPLGDDFLLESEVAQDVYRDHRGNG